MQIAAIDAIDMETFSDEESPQTRSSQDMTIGKILEESEQYSFSTSSEDPSKNGTTCSYNPPHVSLPPHSDDKISPSKVSDEARHTSTLLDDTSICIGRELTSESSKSYDGNWRGGGGGKEGGIGMGWGRGSGEVVRRGNKVGVGGLEQGGRVGTGWEGRQEQGWEDGQDIATE